MPEMWFHVRWPDGAREACYSPSTIVAQAFEAGRAYPLATFVEISRTALNAASDRVRARYGRPCSLALGQLARIEATAERQAAAAGPDAQVVVEALI